MQRRAIHSKKVTRRALSPEEQEWAQDSQAMAGSDDTVMVRGSIPRPFKGVIVCATGVADKTSLFKLALELGATSVSAFTDRVTHLVAETHGGAKYQCAVSRHIPILRPSWITESYRIWQHGDDVDLASSVAAHLLPVFSGVTLCISGIPDLLRRTQIARTLTAHGGTYVKALERPVRVTHLLCGVEGEETDKMRYADKFNRHGEADPPIQLVWEDWFWDSVECGGRFDEGAYQARLPRPEGRRSRPLPPDNSHIPSAFDESVDVEDEEMGGGERGGRVLADDSFRHASGNSMPSTRERERDRTRTSEREHERTRTGSVNGIVNAVAGPSSPPHPNAHERTRTNSNANAVAGPSSTRAGANSKSNPNVNANANAVAGPSKSNAAGIFTSLRFLLRGDSDALTVRQAIEGAGGVVVPFPDSDADYDYVVVRLVSGSPLYAAAPSSQKTKYRTECWLEQCLFVARLCAPDEHPSFVPLAVDLPVPGAGARNAELLGAGRERDVLGGEVGAGVGHHYRADVLPTRHDAPPLSERDGAQVRQGALSFSSFFPFFHRISLKFLKAREWNIPVVNTAWLGEMARTGVIPGPEGFLVAPAEGEADAPATPAQKTNKAKGKEKEKVQEDATMQDITNSYDSQESLPQPQNDDDAGGGAQGEFILPPPPSPREPSFGFGQPDASLGGSAGPPASPTPPKRNSKLVRRVTAGPTTSAGEVPIRPGTPSRARSQSNSRPTTPLPLVAHAVPVPVPPTQSSSTTSSSDACPKTGPRLVRRVAARQRPPPPRTPLRVPSSASPSPLRRGVSVSPPKIPDHRTKALHDSIRSLLDHGQKHKGTKRPATPDEVGEAHGRAGKRGRVRTKSKPSRQPSDALPLPLPLPMPERDPHESVFGGAGRSFSPGIGISMSMDDRYGEGSSAIEGLSMGDEQSLRVMYEDPGQRAELRRLASLIGEPLDEEVPKKRPRRSARRGGGGF
ncbi:hypothetical protein MVEN_02436300 [Mycena venus]|uniref:BRCT domain-containing protein n=1 Tax=Mycena venus TaxID=2733690 RepID=A0A8H6WYS3_9AGAR|nr:hypothetical protein MVEN_02436300 [Mycena venus]